MVQGRSSSFPVFLLLCVAPASSEKRDPLQSLACEFREKRTFICTYTIPSGKGSVLNFQRLFCNNDCDAVSAWGTCLPATGTFAHDCRPSHGGLCNDCIALRLSAQDMDTSCKIVRPLDFIKPGRVRDLKITNKSMTSLRVTWSKPDDYDNFEDKYIYSVSVMTDHETKIGNKTTRKEFVTRYFKKLKAWTRINVTIRARFGAGGLLGDSVHYTYSRPTENTVAVRTDVGETKPALPIIFTVSVLASVILVVLGRLVYRTGGVCELEDIILPDGHAKRSSFSQGQHGRHTNQHENTRDPVPDSGCSLSDSSDICSGTPPVHTNHDPAEHCIHNCPFLERHPNELKFSGVSLNDAVSNKLSKRRIRCPNGSLVHMNCLQYSFPSLEHCTIQEKIKLCDRVIDGHVVDVKEVNADADAEGEDVNDYDVDDVEVSGMSIYRHVPVSVSESSSTDDTSPQLVLDKHKLAPCGVHSSDLSVHSQLSDASRVSVDSYSQMTLPLTSLEGIGCLLNPGLCKENIKRNSVTF